MGWRLFFAISLLVLGLDHGSKWLALEYLKGSPPIDIIPGCFRLDYAINHGAAFSMLEDHPGRLAVLASLGLVFIGLFAWFTPREDRLARLGLAMMFGGAVGNLIDRVVRGYVIDFLDAYIGASHWPTFNVADSAICVGAAFVMWTLLFPAEIEDPSAAEEEAAEGDADAAPADDRLGKPSSAA